jgi:hypothetical protein
MTPFWEATYGLSLDALVYKTPEYKSQLNMIGKSQILIGRR